MAPELVYCVTSLSLWFMALCVVSGPKRPSTAKHAVAAGRFARARRHNAQQLTSFTDIRELQRQLKAQAVQLYQEAHESTTGPAIFVALQPTG